MQLEMALDRDLGLIDVYRHTTLLLILFLQACIRCSSMIQRPSYFGNLSFKCCNLRRVLPLEMYHVSDP